jgi:hypothetical protein
VYFEAETTLYALVAISKPCVTFFQFAGPRNKTKGTIFLKPSK